MGEGVSLNSTAGAGLIPGARNKNMAEKVRLKITKEAYAGGFTYQPGEEVEMAFGAARVLIAQGVAVDADAPAAPKKKAARKPAKKQA